MGSVPWRSLRTSSAGLPTLLVKAELSASGYTIFVTDLSNIWSEHLTRVDLTKRAEQCGSSIDPSQGVDQQEILLNHIGKALNHEDGTTLQVRRDVKDSQKLLLHLFAPLPGTLPPLRWIVQLRTSPSRLMGNELVMPLLHQTLGLRQQVQSLIAEIQNKDRVISKIADRLEVSGNDLTTVFPNVSRVKISRKKPQREQLGSHVQGLSDFDEVSWREQLIRSVGTSDLSLDALDELVGGCAAHKLGRPDDHLADEWWLNLTEEVSPEGVSSQKRVVDQNAADVQHASSQDEHIDDFQRQSTPPQPTHRREALYEPAPVPSPVTDGIKQGAIPLDEESTDDEDDLDASPPNQTASERASQTDHLQAEIQPSEPTTTTYPPEEPSARNQSADIDTEDSTLTHRALAKANKSASKLEHPSRVGDIERATSPDMPKAKPRLGVIGGKRDVSEQASERATSGALPRRQLGMFGGRSKPSTVNDVSSSGRVEAVPERSLLSSPPERSKLGTFGGTKRAMKDEPSSPIGAGPSSHVSTSLSAKDPTPEQEETAEERADRKRVQLKTELEDKAKAQVKKRRKF